RAGRSYDQQNMRTALAFYKKAFNQWPSHPVVRRRYLELSAEPDLKDRPIARPVVKRRFVTRRRRVRSQKQAAPVTIYVLDPKAASAAQDLMAAVGRKPGSAPDGLRLQKLQKVEAQQIALDRKLDSLGVRLLLLDTLAIGLVILLFLVV